MDIKTHWQCLLSSSQDLSKCLLTVKMICTLGTHLFPCSLLSFSHVSYQWHCWVLMDGSSGNFLDEGKVFSKERESKTDRHRNNNNEINLCTFSFYRRPAAIVQIVHIKWINSIQSRSSVSVPLWLIKLQWTRVETKMTSNIFCSRGIGQLGAFF